MQISRRARLPHYPLPKFLDAQQWVCCENPVIEPLFTISGHGLLSAQNGEMGLSRERLNTDPTRQHTLARHAPGNRGGWNLEEIRKARVLILRAEIATWTATWKAIGTATAPV